MQSNAPLATEQLLTTGERIMLACQLPVSLREIQRELLELSESLRTATERACTSSKVADPIHCTASFSGHVCILRWGHTQSRWDETGARTPPRMHKTDSSEHGGTIEWTDGSGATAQFSSKLHG